MVETQLDAVTGLSGSGPAYVFTFLEGLTEAGVKMGLARPVALKLATQTVRGSSQMARGMDLSLSQLKEMVTSPGGTTIYGLHVLEKAGFKNADRRRGNGRPEDQGTRGCTSRTE